MYFFYNNHRRTVSDKNFYGLLNNFIFINLKLKWLQKIIDFLVERPRIKITHQ